MHPEASRLWTGPQWLLAALLACLSMLGPFSIDFYLPAFNGIAQALDATPLQMQQTLSAYLLGFAVMNLFHGSLADAFGRRPVVLVGVAVFALASAGCAFSPGIGSLLACRALQGLSAGAGMVVGRAVIRDMYGPADAQRMMSKVTLFFGVAPALAPVFGGWLFVHLGWRALFLFLVLVAGALWLTMWRWLPETLHESQRQSFHPRDLLAGYAEMLGDMRFVALAFASGLPFNGLFLYVLAAPAFLGEHLGLAPTQFFWFFICSIGGIMGGAWWSGRLAGKLPRERQIRRGFRIMVGTVLLNLLLNLVLPPHPLWAIPVLSGFALGWALMMPVVTLLVLDQVPERRGMASSLQAALGSAANALVAGVLVPLVMHSLVGLALASVGLTAIGLVAWAWVKPRLAQIKPKASTDLT